MGKRVPHVPRVAGLHLRHNGHVSPAPRRHRGHRPEARHGPMRLPASACVIATCDWMSRVVAVALRPALFTLVRAPHWMDDSEERLACVLACVHGDLPRYEVLRSLLLRSTPSG